MKKIILLTIVIVPAIVSMHNSKESVLNAIINATKRVLGMPINAYDDQCKQRISDMNTVDENEVVAFTFEKRLVYGVITCKPKNGEMVLISNSSEDTIRFGRAYNVKTTPTYKLSGTQFDIEKGTDK